VPSCVLTRQNSPSLSPLPRDGSNSCSTLSALSSEACHTPVVASFTNRTDEPWNTNVALFEK
jgi:hypothetical protein